MIRTHGNAALTLAAAATVAIVMSGGGARAQQNVLKGFASLPALTFAAGPVSGQFSNPANGVAPPYAGQPVQGFSSVLSNGDGTFTVLADNGYGSKANSADFTLRFYTITPDFRTASGGSGTVAVNSFVSLSDPFNRVGFPIVADLPSYPNQANPSAPLSAIPVDPLIRNNRLLTGWDFDVESFRRVSDGSYWIGDEFGPYLLHVDAQGRVLEAPISLPNLSGIGANPFVQSPSNPAVLAGTGAANLPNSKGFEGLALSADGTKLYALLEGPLIGDPDRRRLHIYEFDPATAQYTGRQFFYRMENTVESGQAIGEMTAISDTEFLVIERDNNQGAASAFKKIFRIDLSQTDANGFVAKSEVVDLLNIADPNNLGGLGTGTFTFPFVTIESVVVVDNNTIGVLNDNNFPGSAGRAPGVPDNNEFILIGLARPLQTEVPEPGTLVLAATAFLPLAGRARRRVR